MIVRREQPRDVAQVRAVVGAAFAKQEPGEPVEVWLLGDPGYYGRAGTTGAVTAVIPVTRDAAGRPDDHARAVNWTMSAQRRPGDRWQPARRRRTQGGL